MNFIRILPICYFCIVVQGCAALPNGSVTTFVSRKIESIGGTTQDTKASNESANFDRALRHQVNPNGLPICPKPEYSKSTDVERLSKWNNCWGRYKFEFLNGPCPRPTFVLDANGDRIAVHNICQNRYKYELLTGFIGDAYESEWKNGLPHGRGWYIHSNGGAYLGEFKQGKLHGYGEETYANSHHYIGEFYDGKRQGLGIFLFRATNQSAESKYVGEFSEGRAHGQGTHILANGDKYTGEFRKGLYHGQGTYSLRDGSKYVGEFKDGMKHGQGILTTADGKRSGSIWENGKFIRKANVSLVNANNIASSIERDPINLQVTHTQPAADGSLTISVITNTDTASLMINGEEQGGRISGEYFLKKFARAGQETKFTIVATDDNGNKDTKIISVKRAINDSKNTFSTLSPDKVRIQPERDAVAVIIGIADYRSLPKADFANDDARVFYDYAVRALGVKPENIKLLVDGDAEEAEILKVFRNWLPSRVKSSTEVFVFYSGHGLPMSDGKGLLLIPSRADREVIDDTSIPFQKINELINFSKPKSVTMLLDACYSGQARSGGTLVAGLRPVRVKIEEKVFPDSFTVITASQHDQISSSSPELKHGIFSYYLMRGMEGDADANRDGRITLSEMQAYLSENVGRQAAMMSRKQEPQLIGDGNRVLVGR
jgi:hypothetical protein